MEWYQVVQDPYFLSNKLVQSMQVFALLVLGIGIVRGGYVIPDYLDLKESEQVLQSKVDELKQNNQNLGVEIERLKKSRSYARKVLRDKYHIVEEDESIYFFSE